MVKNLSQMRGNQHSIEHFGHFGSEITYWTEYGKSFSQMHANMC